jgi:hypothetical protein
VTTGTLNPRLQEIAGDFGAVAGKERLQLLLEFCVKYRIRPSLPMSGNDRSWSS